MLTEDLSRREPIRRAALPGYSTACTGLDCYASAEAGVDRLSRERDSSAALDDGGTQESMGSGASDRAAVSSLPVWRAGQSYVPRSGLAAVVSAPLPHTSLSD